MNPWTTLILLVFVVVGGVFWFVFSAEPKSVVDDDPPPTPPSKTRNVFDPPPKEADVVRVQFERPGKPRIVFERVEAEEGGRTPAGWRMLEPVKTECERYAVSNFVRFFTDARSEREFGVGDADAPSAADMGLEPPVAVVAVVDKLGKEYKLEVGKKAALSTVTYVRIVGQPTVYVVNRDFTRQIEKEPNEFRSKQLIASVSQDAVRIEIEHDGKTYALVRKSSDHWRIVSPSEAYADAAKLRAYLGQINTLRVVDFVEDAPAGLAAYGLDAPYLRLRVTTEKKQEIAAEDVEPTTQPAEPKFETVTKTYALSIGAFSDMKKEHRYVKLDDQPWIATLLKSSVARVEPKLAEWRDPRIARVKANEVSRLEYTVGDQTVVLAKDNNVWKGEGDLTALEPAAVADVLEALEDVRAIDIIEDPEEASKYGLDHPRSVVKVSSPGEAGTVALRIGAETASGLNAYAQLEGHRSVLVISAAQAKRLAVAPLSLRSREIFAFQRSDIKEVDLTRGEARFALVRENSKWQMSEPAGAPVDVAGISELINDLANLRAKQVVGKDDGAAFGLTIPAVTIQFTVEKAAAPTVPTTQTAPTTQTMPTTQSTQTAPTTQSTQSSQPAAPKREEHTLVVGRVGDDTYCRKDDDPYIFELDSTVYSVFVQEMIDRRIFSFAAADVMGYSVAAPGGSLELVKEDDEWKYAPDPYVKLAQTKVKAFITDLAQLRVDAWLTYSDADLSAAGLENSPVTVVLRLSEDRQITLKIDQEQRGAFPRKAGWVEEKRVFRLRGAEAEKMLRGLDEYLKAETPENPPPTLGPG